MTFFLPLFHNLDGAPCLVIGAGTTALRKLTWLLRAGAKVTVVSPKVQVDVYALAERGALQLEQRPYADGDIRRNLCLVVSATNDADVNRGVYTACKALNVPVNCVDQPELCTVIFPAIVDRAPIVVAISSSAQSPTLARTVRGWIEARLPTSLGSLAELAGRLRSRVKATLPSVEARKMFWEQVFSGETATIALKGDLERAEQAAVDQLRNFSTPVGRVSLVGAGPGDPELITVKGMRIIQEADVILYDKLANTELLKFARRDAQLIDVGKQGPKPGAPPSRADNRSNQQADINRILIEQASAGRHVVRLKGGDPFVYGRGGEELDAALDAAIPIQVIPGITAALGAASIAGIPLTYRDLSQSIRFITGHRVDNLTNLDWPELGRSDQTLVIYMGLVGLTQIVDNLLANGLPADTPSALVEHATMPEERSIFATLGSLVAQVGAADVRGPSTIIVGKVVGRAEGYRQYVS